MIRPIRVARLLGVDVNIDLSFILVIVAAWLYWGRTGGVVPFLYGSLLLVFVYLSVLAHELTHAAVARERDIQVLDVTLSPLAGVARIEQASANPRDELYIALAGPSANLAIFMLLAPLVSLFGIAGGTESLFSAGVRFQNISVSSMISAVAITNLGLMLFNMLPAFPLDGGRVLRAFLATRFGRTTATTIASRIGYGFAVLLILAGLAWRDILPVVLGGFILWAAWSENRIVRIENQMQSLRVGSYALWDGGGISPQVPLRFALRGGPRDMVVTHRGRVVGMLWRTDLLGNLDGGVGGRTVADIMKSPAYIADVSESLWDVQQEMNARHARAIPVTEKGQYRGIFSADRFLVLYRQIAPDLHDREWQIDVEWRDAVLDNLRRGRRKS